MVIPTNAKNVENAHKFIEYMGRPEVAAKLANYVGYSTPNIKARDLLEDDMKNSPIVFPELDKLNNLEVFNDPGDTIVLYDKIWTDVISE